MQQRVNEPHPRSQLSRTAERYIQLVCQIPEVVEVRLGDDDDGPALWTIISATPLNYAPGDRVLEAQVEVLRLMDEPQPGFRLINAQDLDKEWRDAYISGIGPVLWAR